MKEMLKQIGIQIAVSSAYVAVDQAVRDVVSHVLKGHVLPKPADGVKTK
jgi:hypothetical protein